ncbi:MAG: LysR substrate-binding domain-containing protein, partial [Gammaproteobacteria bacterium]
SHEPVALDGITADMAIRYGNGSWPGLVAEKLIDNIFVPACHPALGLRKPADLLRHTLLHFEPRNAISKPADWAAWQRRAKLPKLDVGAGIAFTDETHVIAAALGGQGVALLSRTLVAEEFEAGRLVQPFGPELPGQPFHLVYPAPRRDERPIKAVRDWVMSLPARDRESDPARPLAARATAASDARPRSRVAAARRTGAGTRG